MPVDKGAQLIVQDITKEAREKSAKIISAAKQEAKTLLDAARFGAKEEEERELKEAHKLRKQVQGQVLAEGRMKARREILQKREELIKGVLKEAEKKLLTYTSSKKYEEDLVAIAVRACKKLGSDSIVIRANRRDLKLLTGSKDKIEGELGGEKSVMVSFGGPIQAIGGVRVGTPDGKVEIDETFDGRMRREFETLRVKIARILFEGSR